MPSRRFAERGIGCRRQEADLRRRTVRFRITALATAVVAVSLVVAAFALVIWQRSSLTSSLDTTLAQRADDILALVDDGSMPGSFPGTGTEGFIQLVAGDGTVVASTPNLLGAPALDLAGDGTRGDFIRNLTGLPLDDDEFRVLTRATSDGGLLHVASTYDSVNESVAALAASVSVVVPVLIVSLAALIWWLVGRTLQPVENIRLEVSEIGAADLHRRVPRPGTEDEIDRLAGTMNEMLARVEDSVVRQQRFVADASHELRSPLTRMRTQLELAIPDVSDGERGELRGLLEEVTGMQALVEDLLYLAKADAGVGSMTVEPVDLDDLVLREVRRIEARGRVAVDTTGVSGAHVTGDPGQLTRAVRNLLENAERYAETGVTVGLHERGGMAVLEISDDGAGIAPGLEARVFERFGRVDAARSPSAGGAGLGLPIARDIVERHGGSLNLRTDRDSGAGFVLRIPAAD